MLSSLRATQTPGAGNHHRASYVKRASCGYRWAQCSPSSCHSHAPRFADAAVLQRRLQHAARRDSVTSKAATTDAGATVQRFFETSSGLRLEVLERHPSADQQGDVSRPPLVLVHGLFRAAWCWDQGLMEALARQGYSCYAVSLRGQGGSDLPSGLAKGQGVSLADNINDLQEFVGSLGQPAVLVGHSLGGFFVQEYLHQLAAADSSSKPPPLAGAVLLASACAGTVMAFGDFIKDAGLLEFLKQMWIVANSSHLKDIRIARECWWSQALPVSEAQRYFELIQSSSKVLPYQPNEVANWNPPKPGATAGAAGAALPPVLALGGAKDRIIRPFQVRAAGGFWGASVTILDDGHHDLTLQPDCVATGQALLGWLEQVVVAGSSSSSEGNGASVVAVGRQVLSPVKAPMDGSIMA